MLFCNSMGYEFYFVINYLGFFVLIGRLLFYFNKRVLIRIINIGSLVYCFGKFDFEDFNWDKIKFNYWKVYVCSKIVMASFIMELYCCLQKNGVDIIFFGVYFGFVVIDVGIKIGVIIFKIVFGKWYQGKFEFWIVVLLVYVVELMVYVISVDDVVGGDYYGFIGLFEIKGKIGKVCMNFLVSDIEFGR